MLEDMVDERTKALRIAHTALQQNRLQIVRTLSRAAEYRDNETGNHIIRMSNTSVLLGNAIGLDEEQCELLLNASPMHDIGKIGIPDGILLKPGKLQPNEWEIMKTHTQIGAHILSSDDSNLMLMAKEVALTYHEKWDGSGYPGGLKGRSIPLVGRICALTDVFDALTSARPYKKAWPLEKAVAYMKEESGSHFDPELVTHFITLLPQIIEIYKKYADTIVADSKGNH